VLTKQGRGDLHTWPMAAKLPLVVEVVVGNARGSVSESLSAADRGGQEGARDSSLARCTCTCTGRRQKRRRRELCLAAPHTRSVPNNI
jgi:hypothetical protein